MPTSHLAIVPTAPGSRDDETGPAPLSGSSSVMPGQAIQAHPVLFETPAPDSFIFGAFGPCSTFLSRDDLTEMAATLLHLPSANGMAV